MNRVAWVLVAVAVSSTAGYMLGRSRVMEGGAVGSQAPSPLIAEWPGGGVTVADLQAAYRERAPLTRAEALLPSGRKALLDEVIEARRLAEEARRRGLQEDSVGQYKVDQVLAERLLEVEFGSTSSRMAVSDADVEAWLSEHDQEFERPELLRLRVVQLGAEDSARASDLMRQLEAEVPRDSHAFARLARQHSQHRSRAADGDLGFLTREQLAGELGAEVAGVVWALAPGTLTGPLDSPGGPLLVLVDTRRAAARTDPGTVRPLILERIRSERREREITAFKKAITAEVKLSLNDLAAASLTVTP